ncbi:MAG TPA: hypothetical protein VL137_07045 [Polyangiaceae bacterium]|nr:hypothetical protein [Polyangiaceae bacterium]
MMYAQAHNAQADDSWFVAFGPNDVRTLSLEQLDDAYRLDVINDETLVCSTAMNSWVPLGVVAGVRAETRPNVDSLVPNSMAPAAYDVAPIHHHESSTASPWSSVFVLVVICGGLFVAHRLGQLSRLAGSIGMQAQYSALAARVAGAPDINTLTGTEALLHHLNLMYQIDDLHSLARRYELAAPHAMTPAVPQAQPQQAPNQAIQNQANQNQANPAPAEAVPAASVVQPEEADKAPTVDISSLPQAASESATLPAAKPIAPSSVAPSPARSTKVPAAKPAAVQSSPQTLDFAAMKDALDRSKAKHQRARADKSSEYDPLRGLPPQ